MINDLGSLICLPLPNLTKWFDEVNLFCTRFHTIELENKQKRISAQVGLQELAYETKDFKLLKLRAHDLKASLAIMGSLSLLEEKLNILELINEENPVLEKALKEVKDILLKSLFEAKLFKI